MAEEIRINARSKPKMEDDQINKINQNYVKQERVPVREKAAFASKVGTEPDESVKGCVRHCISVLTSDEASAP